MAIRTNNATSAGIFYPAVSKLDNLPAITVAAWVRAFGFGGGNLGRIVSRESAASLGWSYACASSGAMQIQTSASGTAMFCPSSQLLNVGTAATAQWQHVAVTWDGSLFIAGVQHYYNGVAVGNGVTQNGSGTRLNDSAFPWTIGNRPPLSRQWNGEIAELGVWRGRLSPEDIRSLAQGISCRAVAPSLAVWTAPLIRSVNPAEVLVLPTSSTGISVATHPRTFAQ
jgi:hypothetical protein